MDEESQRKLEKELNQLTKQKLRVEAKIKELTQKEKELEVDGHPGKSKRGREDDDRTFVRSVVRREDGRGGKRDESRNFSESRRNQQPLASEIQNGEYEKPQLTSAIVTTGAVISTGVGERPNTVLTAPNSEIQKRNRKMFGVLIGTLESFKKQLSTTAESETSVKRKQLEQKVEQKVSTQQSEALKHEIQELHSLIQKEQQLFDELHQKTEQKETELLSQKKEVHERLLSRFRKTTSKPCIYWLDLPSLQALPSLSSSSSSAQPQSSSSSNSSSTASNNSTGPANPPSTNSSSTPTSNSSSTSSSHPSSTSEASTTQTESAKPSSEQETAVRDTKSENKTSKSEEGDVNGDTDTDSDTDQKDAKSSSSSSSTSTAPSSATTTPAVSQPTEAKKKAQSEETEEEDGSDVENLPE